MNTIKQFILMACLSNALAVQAQQNYTTAWNEFISNSSNNVLLDFSYAGYNHGLNLPADNYPGYSVYNVTKYGAIPNDGKSDRKALEQVIKAIGQKPKANAVIYFPEGDFILHSAEDDMIDSLTGKLKSPNINLVMGNVVLRGAGRDKTTLSMTAPMQPADPNKLYSSPVLLSFRNNGVKTPTVYTKVTGTAAKNSFSIMVENTSALSVGQWVCLNMIPNNQIDVIKEELCGRMPDKTMTDLIRNGVRVRDYHQIKEIKGNEVIFEEPIMHAVNPAYGWQLTEYRHYEGVGVEDLTFVGQATPFFKHHASWKDDGGYKPLDFVRLTNSWLRRVGFRSISECATFQDCANVSCYDVEISGNRGHSAVRMAATSRGFIANVYDHSDGYVTSDTQFATFKTGLGQYHACGVSKTSMGNVIWNCQWGDDACFESHATQPRASLFDYCKGGFMQLRMGGDLSQLPNHLDDLTLWNFNCTVTNPAEFPFAWWDTSRSKWYKSLPPTIVGFHGTSVTFADDQTKRNESQGQMVSPRSLYVAQLEKRLGFVPDWIRQLSGNMSIDTGKTWDFTTPSPDDVQRIQSANDWVQTTSGNYRFYSNLQSIGLSSGTNTVAPENVKLYSSPLMAANQEISMTRNLLFGIYVNGLCKPLGTDKIMIGLDNGNRCLRLNASAIAVVIPNCKKGQQVIIHSKSTTSTIARYIKATSNLNIRAGFAPPSDPSQVQESVGVVINDGDVVLTTENGNYLYDITVKDADGNVRTGVDEQTKMSMDHRSNSSYNLAGQRIGREYKGLVIRNGKKYVQR